jgi:hypothetical protein
MAIQQSLATGTYAVWARNAVRMNQQMQALNKQMHWQDLIAQHGKLGAGMVLFREKVEEATPALRQFGAVAGATFAAGSAQILALTAAASPDAINTFTGSIKLLSGEVGTIFLPYMVQASKFVQDLRYEFRSLSPETRDNIAKFIVMGTAAAGAAAALTGLALAIIKVGTALTTLAAHPVVLAFMAIAAAAAYAAYNIYQVHKANAAILQMQGGRFTAAQYFQSQEYQRVAGVREQFGETRAKGEATKQAMELSDKEEAVSKSFAGRLATNTWSGGGLRYLSSIMNWQAGVPVPFAGDAVHNIQRSAATARAVQQDVVGGKGPTITDKDRLLMSMQMAPAQISEIGDVMKNLEVKTISEGPLERAREAQEAENNQRFRQLVDDVREIKNKPGGAIA